MTVLAAKKVTIGMRFEGSRVTQAAQGFEQMSAQETWSLRVDKSRLCQREMNEVVNGLKVPKVDEYVAPKTISLERMLTLILDRLTLLFHQ